MTAAMTNIYTMVPGFESQFEDYVDESSFLWMLRSRALNQPHYTPHDLAELESRIDGQLLALSMAPDAAWDACCQALETADAGEIFTVAMVAFKSLDARRIQQAVEVALEASDGITALVSALTWLPGRYCHDWLRKFFTSKDLRHKRVALAACCARGEDPCDYLTRILRRDDCRADEALHIEAIGAAGHFKRRDLSPFVVEARETEQASLFLAAHRAAILLGDRRAALALAPMALNPGPWQRDALCLGVRVIPDREAKRWVSQVHQQSEVHGAARLAIEGAAALGDPEVISWLLGCMKNLELARVAGEAFFQITGIHLEEQDLHHRLPQMERDESEDDPSTPVPPLDDDEHLPWPSSEKLAMFWQTIKHRFQSGRRYLLGQPVTLEQVRQVYASGHQRQRRAAALEWALLEPTRPAPCIECRQGADNE